MFIPGLTSITFRQLEPEAIIDLAASCGLKAIEWGGDVHAPPGDTTRAAQLRERTRAAGLEVSSYGSYYRAGMDQQAGASFEAVLDTAIALGAPTIRVWAGAAGSADTGPTQRKRIVDDLRRVSDLADRRGVALGIEFHADTLTDTDGSAKRLVDEIGRPSSSLYWQPPNGIPHVQAERGLVELLPHITNVHVFEWSVAQGQIIRHPLSAGSSHWPGYLSVLEQSGRDRYALIEFVANDRVEQLHDDARILLDWLDHTKQVL